MTSLFRFAVSAALALSLSGCVWYGHPYHRHWHGPYSGRPGYWR